MIPSFLILFKYMKKLIKCCCLSIAAILASGCSSDSETLFHNTDNDEVLVKFNLCLEVIQENETPTRSLATGYHFSDGKSISIVKCYIYNQSYGTNASPVKTFDINVNKLKGEIAIPLPKKDIFDIVFLATSIDQTDSSSKMYYDTTDRSLNINYALVKNNDEEMDCFYAVQKGVSSDNTTTKNVELKRPFAQLNIGAKDYAEYDASKPVASTSVEVKGIYNKMSLMDGNVVGSPIDVVFSESKIPNNQIYPIVGAQYIAMNYLLVNQRKLIETTISFNHYDTSNDPLEITFKDIAVERNYQTNVTIQALN